MWWWSGRRWRAAATCCCDARVRAVDRAHGGRGAVAPRCGDVEQTNETEHKLTKPWSLAALSNVHRNAESRGLRLCASRLPYVGLNGNAASYIQQSIKPFVAPHTGWGLAQCQGPCTHRPPGIWAQKPVGQWASSAAGQGGACIGLLVPPSYCSHAPSAHPHTVAPASHTRRAPPSAFRAAHGPVTSPSCGGNPAAATPTPLGPSTHTQQHLTTRPPHALRPNPRTHRPLHRPLATCATASTSHHSSTAAVAPAAAPLTAAAPPAAPAAVPSQSSFFPRLAASRSR